MVKFDLLAPVQLMGEGPSRPQIWKYGLTEYLPPAPSLTWLATISASKNVGNSKLFVCRKRHLLELINCDHLGGHSSVAHIEGNAGVTIDMRYDLSLG